MYVSVCMHCICVVYRCRCHCRSRISHQVNITSIHFVVGVFVYLRDEMFCKNSRVIAQKFSVPVAHAPAFLPTDEDILGS
jgi:hypothetical protein